MSDLARSVGEGLARRGLRLAVAESCTGGLLAADLTGHAGSSRFFAAGIVTYSDESKQHLLGVGHDTLATFGAVSGNVAREMLDGVAARTSAGAALSITGIAGPDGGTREKPVGTVWIGASVGAVSVVERFHFEGDRDAVRRQSVVAALRCLGRLLEVGS